MYQIPTALKSEIEEFEKQVIEFKNGTIEAVKFKAIRVPMGIYEQRENGSFMVRVRCAAGMITPNQLFGVATLATQYNIGTIHITTRQELQLHDVKLEQTPIILSELYKLGLSSRGGGGNTVRNIMASEDARITASENFDVSPYALVLTNTLIAESDSWSLPRKYKIAFSGNDSDNSNALFNDLGFVATLKANEKGFKVYLGGGLGSKPSTGHLLFDFLPANDILYVAEAVKQLFSEHGNRRNRHKARIRYLFYKLGEEKVFELFHQYYKKLKQDKAYELAVPTLLEVKDRGTKVDGAADGVYLQWLKRFAKEQVQEGLYTVEIPFEHGITTPQILKSIATFLQSLKGEDLLRFNMRQNIRLRNIPGNVLPTLYQLLLELKIEVNTPKLLNNLVACTGADTCRLGICLAKGASHAIKNQLSKLDTDTLDQLSELEINLSGCPNSCGQHAVSPLGFYGKASRTDRLYPAYYVTVGGKRGVNQAELGKNMGEINARELPEFITEVVNAYHVNATKYTDFHDFVTKDKSANVLAILKKYQHVPAFDDDKNYYFDWGAQDLFSLKGKGVAECSAGMFDMIDFDKDSILEIRKRMTTAEDDKTVNNLLYQTIFHASRMLLVTRGIEPKNKNEVFEYFIKSFIEEGLVDSKYLNVISQANINQNEDFSSSSILINELADEVIALYENMDDSLQFKLKDKPNSSGQIHEEESKKDRNNIRIKDFRGVACPMNFVKTKIELAQMRSEELLEIFLDDGAPINNVPGSVRGEGHQVLEVKQKGEYWSVLIQKK